MHLWTLLILCLACVQCGGGGIATDDAADETEEATSTIGGSVSGLSGTLVLQNNESDNLTLTENGAFTFATALADGTAYSVTVLTGPSGQTCTLSSNTGTVNGANVTDVSVVCTADGSYVIGGTLTNLGASQSITLRNNGGDDLTKTSSGSFLFTTATTDGNAYAVTVFSQPSRQTCTVTNGSGTVNAANVTDVAVTCVTNGPRIFKTSTQFTGDLKTNGSAATGVAGADSLCMSNSSYPGIGTYKALIVDGSNRVACTTASCSGGASEHTDWVLAASTTYVRTDDTTTIGTTTSAGIFNFNLTNGFSGVTNGHWTGLNTNWTSNSNHCGTSAGDWATSSNGVSGMIGVSDSTTSSAISSGGSDTCNFMDRLICVEQ